MSKVCPHCGAKDFHLQTPAVFHFDGDDFVGDELLCDITENLNMADFDDSHLICNKCDWDGKVRDLIEANNPETKTVEEMRLKAKSHDELVAHIRELENRLHGIFCAVDGPEGASDNDIIELVRSYVLEASWMVKPRCPECGWCLNIRRATATPDWRNYLHCDNPDCGYVKRVSDGKEGTIEELLELVDSNGKDVKLKPAFWLVVQGYERQTQCSFEPTKPSGQKATCGVVLDCFRCSKERAAAAGVNRKISDPELDLYVMPWPVALPTGTFLAALLNAERIPED